MRSSTAVTRIFTLAWIACGAATVHAADIEVVKVRPNFYMLAGDGANIGVQIGSDGVVAIDAGSGKASADVIAAIKKLTDLPIRYVINTGADADHVGGNGNLAKSGYTIFSNAIGNVGMANAMTNGGGASILAHDSVLGRMSAATGKTSPFPVEAWPTEAFFQDRKYLRMSGEGIEILRQPAAHSNADSMVFFRGSDVVVAGDVMDTTRFPMIDVANGGTIQGEIEALNKLISLAIPALPFIYKGDGTAVIPGHGRVCEQQDVVDYRDMVVIVRDVVADLVKQGKTLDQIKEARPAKPFETQYGTQPGVTNQFIEAIHKTLNTPSGAKK
jgi:glyoxylase-like metal-dependent hydrolase (beta-lactamase superfamily II)